ncbi:hypothetical protein [Micromonospora tulbaghiae]|uniref:hypothetical protein n=1 Tax=Micromonospora tulbaghiae TaxID=479978 RepID=UPI0036B7A414
MSGVRPSESEQRDEAGSSPVVLCLVAAPGAATDLMRRLEPDLADLIASRLRGVEWAVRCVSDRLVEWPADLSQLVAAARRRMLDENGHLVVSITDLPLQTARRPVVAHASMTHGVAVLSLPALGAVDVVHRARETTVRLVAALVGGDSEPASVDRRLRELGDRVDEHGGAFGFVTGVVTGNVRLLLGMLRANRPWRLAIRLSRALVAALTAGVFALVTSDIWRLSQDADPARLGLLTAGSVVAVTLTIVIGAGLWERAPEQPRAREQVVLFNIVTLATVVIGVLALYLALLALTLAGAFLLLPEATLADALGYRPGVGAVAELAWAATSIATVGGALGAGLETDEAVREAAYGYQPDEQLQR